MLGPAMSFFTFDCSLPQKEHLSFVVGSAIIEKIQKGATDSDVSAFISSLSTSTHLE